MKKVLFVALMSFSLSAFAVASGVPVVSTISNATPAAKVTPSKTHKKHIREVAAKK